MSDQAETNDTDTRQTVAVGVDGSSANEAAVLWAAQTADRRGLVLDVIHVVDEALRTSPYVSMAQIRLASREILNIATEQVAEYFPDLPVTTEQLFGHPAHALREASADAAMLVLGRRGRGSFSRMLLGSVSAAVGNRATVPTAVIPAGWDRLGSPTARMVVGIDGSDVGVRAMGYAADLANELGIELRVVYVWGPQAVFPAENALAHGGIAGWRKDAAELLSAVADSSRGKYPNLTISEVLREGHIVRELADESATASTLIVGGHDANRVHAYLARSTTSGVLHHAECPIIVVPESANS
jgi:nucleotide-binding universal stress UspA family protein